VPWLTFTKYDEIVAFFVTAGNDVDAVLVAPLCAMHAFADSNPS
jgi:hypothetical protein